MEAGLKGGPPSLLRDGGPSAKKDEMCGTWKEARVASTSRH